MKKIAVFSDIHGNLQALQAILEDIKKEPIDSIICLGDVIGIGPNSKETLRLIEENQNDVRIPNKRKYNLFGHIHNKFYFENGENKYYCLGSSGCVHNDKTFYNVIYVDNKIVEIKEKIIKFDRDAFESSVQKVNYPEKQEIYNKFFKVL